MSFGFNFIQQKLSDMYNVERNIRETLRTKM